MSDITTGSVTANGLDFGYLEAGPADGPPGTASCTAFPTRRTPGGTFMRARRRRFAPSPRHAGFAPT